MAENDFGISNWAKRTVDEGKIGDLYRWPHKWYKRKKQEWKEKLTPSWFQGKSRLERKYQKLMKVKGMNLAIATSLINSKEEFENVRDLKNLSVERLREIYPMDETLAKDIIKAIKKKEEQPVDRIKISEFVKDLKTQEGSQDDDAEEEEEEEEEEGKAESLKEKLAADKEKKANKDKPDTGEDSEGAKKKSWLPWSNK